MAGHTARHSKTSPLLMLNVSFAQAGDVAAHSQARARRSASTASRTHDGPPRKRQRAPGLALQRTIDADGRDQVHVAAERFAKDHLRPQDRPAPRLPGLPRAE